MPMTSTPSLDALNAKLAENANKPVPLSTEVSPEVNAKIIAVCQAEDRSRSSVARRILTEWASKQPSPVKSKK